MSSYFTYIKNLADSDESESFVNHGKDDAIFTFSTIFNKAESIIKMLSGNLKSGIADSKEYQESLNAFLQRNGRLQILIQDYNAEAQPEIFELFRLNALLGRGEQIEIKTTKLCVRIDESEVHFCVADNKMYRIENDIEKFSAYGNFNNPVFATALADIFDKLFTDTTHTSPVLLQSKHSDIIIS
ncbi:MAG TPA: hypothetical protein VK174_16605 [Chitinophagales bacterium]|nr:hypothetical protein [Chitinophagales bacterium]